MKILRTIYFALTVTFLTAAAFAHADSKIPSSAQLAGSANPVNEKWMSEGQKRYTANCGRCHQSPHKFSPREMSMAIRHMRVRAMLTEDDMNYVLYYMTHQ